MISDPGLLKSKVQSRKKELVGILKKLKKYKPREVDLRFHSLHDEAFTKINCLECANCCRGLGPRITPSDISRLSAFLKIKETDLMKKYITTDEDGDYVFRESPCPFLLQDNYCSVYVSRPKACREYPHTNQKNIKSILAICLENTKTCPAVYYIFHELSRKL